MWSDSATLPVTQDEGTVIIIAESLSQAQVPTRLAMFRQAATFKDECTTGVAVTEFACYRLLTVAVAPANCDGSASRRLCFSGCVWLSTSAPSLQQP